MCNPAKNGEEQAPEKPAPEAFSSAECPECAGRGGRRRAIGAAFIRLFAAARPKGGPGAREAPGGECASTHEGGDTGDDDAPEAPCVEGVLLRGSQGGGEAGGEGAGGRPRYETREQEAYSHIAKYAKPDDGVAAWETVKTLAVYGALFFLSFTYDGPLQWPVTVALTVACGLTRTRVFCLMHDMAHHSFFSSRAANVVGATLLGALVYTPYSGWKRGHDYHHRHSNNTDRKQTAQTAPCTVAQFRALPRWRQWVYRLIYGHYTLVTTTPWLYFVVVQRLMSRWWENALVGAYWAWILGSGDRRLLCTDVLTAAIGASMGVFLFHIQHTFEGAYKASSENYSRFENGMHGSSYLIVPECLKFFTASIEYHNVHHLNTRVPLYRLRQAFEDGPHIFAGVPTFTMWEAFRRLPYSLRQDEDRTFVSCYDED